MKRFAISVNTKQFFVRSNFAVFKVIICENRKLSFLCLKHLLFQHLHKNQKWTVMRLSQMVNVAKHALISKVFSPLFTQAWKLILFILLSTCHICIISNERYLINWSITHFFFFFFFIIVVFGLIDNHRLDGVGSSIFSSRLRGSRILVRWETPAPVLRVKMISPLHGICRKWSRWTIFPQRTT